MIGGGKIVSMDETARGSSANWPRATTKEPVMDPAAISLCLIDALQFKPEAVIIVCLIILLARVFKPKEVIFRL
jgi:hypothetical protein